MSPGLGTQTGHRKYVRTLVEYIKFKWVWVSKWASTVDDSQLDLMEGNLVFTCGEDLKDTPGVRCWVAWLAGCSLRRGWKVDCGQLGWLRLPGCQGAVVPGVWEEGTGLNWETACPVLESDGLGLDSWFSLCHWVHLGKLSNSAHLMSSRIKWR